MRPCISPPYSCFGCLNSNRSDSSSVADCGPSSPPGSCHVSMETWLFCHCPFDPGERPYVSDNTRQLMPVLRWIPSLESLTLQPPPTSLILQA